MAKKAMYRSWFKREAPRHTISGMLLPALALAAACLSTGAASSQTPLPTNEAERLFEPIRSVLQHPRCQNCHIAGDRPLQFDSGQLHAQNVMRGTDGRGRVGMRCTTCHQSQNPPAVLGPYAPPGAPDWHLPPSNMKMVFKDLSSHAVCVTLKDPQLNGGKSLDDLVHHFAEDKLVDWGWHPGGNRTVLPLTKEQTVAAVKGWVAAGAPCPRE